MKKMKKFISLALALLMIMSVCPLGMTGLSTVASAASTPVWSYQSATESSVGAEVTYSTNVLRVASGPNSYLKGSKVVATTESGTPEPSVNTTYANISTIALAGETIVTPTVRLSLTANADNSPAPAISFSSMNNQTLNLAYTVIGASGRSYEWQITADGSSSTATAGDTVLVTITYYVGGIQYTSYGALNVQYVNGGVGADLARVKTANGTGGGYKSRFNAAYRVVSKNLYCEVNGSGTYGGFTASGSSHASFNFSAATIGLDVGGIETFHPNDNNQALLGCYTNSNGDGGKNNNPYNLGYANDENRAQGTIYIDTSVTPTVSDLDLRYELISTGKGDGNDVYAENFYINKSYLGVYSYDVGKNTNDNPNTGNDSTINFIGQPNTGSSYGISNRSVGNSRVEYFTNGSVALTSLPLSTGSASKQFSWNIELNGQYGGESCKSGTSSSYSLYVVNKGDLRNLISLISSGKTTSGATSFIPTANGTSSYSSTSISATKGANPQAANFTSASYSTFVSAYQAAVKELANGKSKNQNTIKTCFDNLWAAYTGLSANQATVTAHFILQGAGTSVYADSTYTGNAGGTVTCTAPDVTGYELVSEQTLSAACTAGNEITFTYKKASFTYTFDPVVVQAGHSKTASFEYGSTFDPIAQGPNFVYDYHYIEGYYRNYDSSTGTYSNKVTSVNVDGSTFTLYAKWAVSPVYVNYDLSAAGSTMEATQYMPGDTIAAPASPVVPGYAFLGWYKASDFSEAFVWNTQIGYESLTAYAKFQAYDNKIVFNSNGGGNIEDVNVEGLSAGASVTLPAPTRTGYTFQGWYANENLTGTVYPAGAQGLPASLVGGGVLYAKWTKNAITLNFHVGYNSFGASPIDTQADPESISGYVGDSIAQTVANSGGLYVLPADPVKYGYTFGGWYSGSSPKTYNTTSAYESAVNGNAITLVDPDTDNFPAVNSASVNLYPVWVKSDRSAYIELNAYKESFGADVPVDEAEIATGDIITVRMTSTTNFYTGSSLFVYMYDNSFFSLVGSGSDAFEVNDENGYISAISGTNGCDYAGYTQSPAAAECPSGYNWIQIAIDPDVLGGVTNGGAMTDGKWMVTFRLQVIGTTPGSSGVVYMDNDWTRTPENNDGTMFYSWLGSATTPAWQGHNNYITPDLTLATATVTLPDVPVTTVQSTITADPNGGTWSDDSTGTKNYTGDEGEIILGYKDPVKRGYELTSWDCTADASDKWISGFYGAAAQNGKTYKAQWTPKNYNVTWNATSGAFTGGQTLTDAVAYEAEYSNPSTAPVKQGYVVTGWSLTEDGDAVTFPQTMSDTDVTYFAIWGPASDTPFKVIVNYRNNSTGTEISSAQASGVNGAFVGTTGSTVHLVADKTGLVNTATDTYIGYEDLPKMVNGNYVFDSSNPNNETECTILADGTAAINVYYRGKLVTATLDANGGTFSGYAQASEKDSYGVGYEYTTDSTYVITNEYQTSFADSEDNTKPALAPVTPTKTGYEFVAWGTSATATRPATFGSATTDRTLYAIWTGMTVSNIFDANGGSFAGAQTTTVDSTFGAAIKLPTTAPTRAGYEFKGWAAAADATTGSTSLGTQSATTPATYYAVWQLTNQTYNINVYYMNTDGTYPTAASVSSTNSAIGAVSISADTYAKAGFTFDTDAANVLSATLDETTAGTTVTLKAYFKRNTYTAVFMSDGAQYTTVDALYEAAIAAPTAPTKTGYDFNGWAATADGAVLSSLGNMPIDGTTFYAKWTVHNWAIDYWTYDGATKLTTQNYDYNADITPYVNTTTKVGYSFAGWATSANQATGTDVLGNNGKMPDNALTYYVAFAPNSYDATFISDGTTYKTESFAYGTAITEPTAPTKAGYTFGGWAATADGAALSSLGNMDSVDGKTFYAVWTPEIHDYKVNVYYMNTDGTYTGVAPEVKTLQAAVDSTVTISQYDYVLEGFGGEEQSLDTTLSTLTGVIPATGTLELNVYCERNTYTITYRSMSAGGITFTDSAAASAVNSEITTNTATRVIRADTWYYGDTVVPAVPVKDGYTITMTEVPAEMPAQNISITITVQANPYTATFISDGIEFTTKDVNFNSAITAPDTEPTKTGYTFKGWSRTENATAADASLGNMNSTSGVTFYAVFEINNYTATFYDYNDAVLGTTKADYNTAISALAKEDEPTREGYTFAGWAAAKDGTALDSLGNMPVDGTSFYAVYTVNQYTFKWIVDGEENEVKYDFGAAVETPESPEKDGYTFAGWSPEVPGTMPSSDVTVTAQWTINSYDLTINYVYADNSTAATTYTAKVVYDTGYSVDSPEITGFTADKLTVAGTMPASDVEVTVKYTANSLNLTINYEYADGTKAAEPYTAKVDYNTGYSVDSPAITGYTADQTTVAGTMPANDVEVTVTYTVNAYTLTINYKYADGTEAKAAHTAQVNYSDSYSVTSPVITGYTADKLTVAGTMPADDVTVDVTYTVNAYSLTVKYEYADGTEAKTAHTAQVNYNESYSVDSPAITGYTPDQATVAGTMPANNVEVTVKYAINSYDLTINYVYADNSTASATFTQKVEYNKSYSVTSPVITGFTADKLTVAGTMPADDVTVDVTYTVNSYTLTITYVTPDGITAPAVYTDTVNYGSTYSVESPSVTGCTVETGKATVAGTMPANNVEVTVNYTLNSYTLTFAAPKRLADGTLSTVDMSNADTYQVINTTSVLYNSAITAPAAPSIEYYTFNNTWSPEFTGVMPAADTVYVAQYDRDKVEITVPDDSTMVIETVDEDSTTFTGYIYGLDNNTTVDEFVNELSGLSGDSSVVVTPVEAYNQFNRVGTSTKVEVIDNVTDEVVATYYVVIYGDINGDGMCDTSDVQLMRAEASSTPLLTSGLWSVDETGKALEPSEVSAPILKAADLNGDGIITSADTTIIRQLSTYRVTVDQQTGVIS